MREAAAGSPAACVAARVVAARRGGAGRGPARGGEWRAHALEGTWPGEERRGAARAQETAGKGGGVTGAERNRGREGGLEVDDEDLSAIFQKYRDSTVKPN
jgi:hypothetical protein